MNSEQEVVILTANLHERLEILHIDLNFICLKFSTYILQIYIALQTALQLNSYAVKSK